MAAPWVRVDANLPYSPLIASLRKVLGVSRMETLGHYVALLLAVARHAPDGRVSDFDDEVIESWAMWTGEPGKFARAVRKACLTADGEVRGWRESMGQLIERAEKDRDRKRRARAGTATDSPRTVRGQSVKNPRLRNGTKRNGTDERSIERSSQEVSEQRAPSCTPRTSTLIARLQVANPDDLVTDDD